MNSVLPRIINTINNTCVINVKNTRICKFGIVVYAYCSHSCCKSFEIRRIQLNNQVDITLFNNTLHYNHLGKKTRYCKGVKREIIADEIKSMTPRQYRKNVVNDCTPIKCVAGNLGDVKLASVFQKIASEVKSSADYDKDDYLDLKEMKHHLSFIKYVLEDPFTVYAHDFIQFDIIKMLLKFRSKLTVHIDATGTVVRKPKPDTGRILYYVLVVNIPEDSKSEASSDFILQLKGSLCPVAEMVTERHSAENILMWLTSYRNFLDCEHGTWPVFTNIVSDFSYASLNAIARAWNGHRSIFHYLNTCHKILIGNIPLNSEMIIISLCCAHYIKVIVKHIASHYKNENCWIERNFVIIIQYY